MTLEDVHAEVESLGSEVSALNLEITKQYAQIQAVLRDILRMLQTRQD
jgi:hypothetical protein